MLLDTFTGEVRTTVDAKGRTSFPREFRNALTAEDGEELVLTIHRENCLKLYTSKEWILFEKRLTDKVLSAEDAEERDKRLFLLTTVKSKTVRCHLDGQNRILIPRNLLEHADISKEMVYVADLGKTLTLWDPDSLLRIREEKAKKYSAALNDLI